MTRAEAIAKSKAAIRACIDDWQPDCSTFGVIFAYAFPEGQGRTAEGVSLSRCLDAAIQQMKRDGVIVCSRKKGCWVRA